MKLKNAFKKIRKNVYVKDIMSKKVLKLDKTDNVFKAIKVMAKESISTIVTSHKTNPIGILTERDLVKKLLLKGKDPKKVMIIDIMTKNPVVVKKNTTVLRASNIMKKNKVRKLVVVDDKNNLIGILSQTDIINSMYRISEGYRSLFFDPMISIISIIVVIILIIFNNILFKT